MYAVTMTKGSVNDDAISDMETQAETYVNA